MLRKLLDSNNSIGWIIASIGIIMVGMFSIIFIPVIMSLTRFQTKTNIGFTPNEGIYFYLVLAFLVLADGLSEISYCVFLPMDDSPDGSRVLSHLKVFGSEVSDFVSNGICIVPRSRKTFFA